MLCASFNHRVGAGETITLVAPPPEDPEPQPENIPLAILYEDDQLIVINKPAGLVVPDRTALRRISDATE